LASSSELTVEEINRLNSLRNQFRENVDYWNKGGFKDKIYWLNS